METLSREKLRILRSLSSRKVRERRGLCLVEGERSLIEAQRSGLLRYMVADTDAEPQLPEELTGGEASFFVLEHRLFSDVSEVAHSTGLLGVAAIPEPLPPGGFTAGPGGSCRLVYLDGLADPANAGAVIRSAWALGFDAIASGPGTADIFSARAVRASAGAVFHLPRLAAARPDAPDTPNTLETLAASGFTLYCAEAHGTPCRQVSFPDRAVLVLGNEARGVSEAAGRLAAPVAVPMRPGADSLNVVVAGSIIMAAMVA